MQARGRVLEYATRPRNPPPVAIAFCVSLAFVIGHVIIEAVSYYLLTFQFHIVEPNATPYRLSKLWDKYQFDMILEAIWGGIAGIVVLVVLLVLFAARQRSAATATFERSLKAGLFVGWLWCWLRWGIWGVYQATGDRYPEATDFKIAMALAVAAGALLAFVCRSKSSAHNLSSLPESL